jgi:putative tricarboxylic transport membrane protein
LEGIAVVWRYRWTAVRGGVIGALVGVMPGLGGGVADWLSYGATVAANPNEQFGKGNIKGVIGCEGANNAQKATSMIPTILFGIPGAPFAAIILALLSYLNFEVGTAQLAQDSSFFAALAFGFMAATVLVAVICLAATPVISLLTRIPYVYYLPVVVALIVWSCVQYTGRWEDYAILALCSALGFACKRFRFSRPALLLGFILSHRVEAYTIQLTSLYTWQELITRPSFVVMMLCFVAILAGGLFRKSTLEYE